MKKFIVISVSVLLLLAFLFFLLFFVLEENKLTETLRKETEDNIALVVNDTPVTERELEEYIREIARDRFRENLSREEIRDLAIEKAIEAMLMDEYFKEKGVVVLGEEIEEEFLLRIKDLPGAETEEEFFEIMARQGFSREEIERDIKISIKTDKLFDLLEKNIDITEEDLLQEYERYKETERMILSYEVVKSILERNLTRSIAEEMIADELDERRERVDVEIMK